MENYIIALASVNIMLPAVTIYKLSASNFGRTYNVPLETLYKVLHLLLVNLPFLAFRIYLWQMFSTDTAIFMIKNVYAIVAFTRSIYPDIKLLQQLLHRRMELRNLPASNKSSASVNGSNGGNGIQVVFRNERNSSPNVGQPTADREQNSSSVSIEGGHGKAHPLQFK